MKSSHNRKTETFGVKSWQRLYNKVFCVVNGEMNYVHEFEITLSIQNEGRFNTIPFGGI